MEKFKKHNFDTPNQTNYQNYPKDSKNTFENSLNNGYVEGSFITLLEPVGGPADPKSVAHNLVAPRTCSPPNLVAPRTCSSPI